MDSLCGYFVFTMFFWNTNSVFSKIHCVIWKYIGIFYRHNIHVLYTYYTPYVEGKLSISSSDAKAFVSQVDTTKSQI